MRRVAEPDAPVATLIAMATKFTTAVAYEPTGGQPQAILTSEERRKFSVG